MPLQENVSVTLTYGIQTDFATIATGAGTSQRVRRTGASLNVNKQGFASNEVRSDLQVATFRHGGQSASGSISGELAVGAWDDFFAAIMRNTWGTISDYTQATGTNVSATGSVFTFGAGSLITAGFKVGDVVRFASLPAGGAPNNNRNFRVTGMTATTMTVTPAPTAFTVQTTFTLSRPGRKLTLGTTRTAFTLEQNYPELDMSEVFDGMRIGGCQLRLPPNGIASCDWSFQGRRGQVLTAGSAPYFTAATAVGTTEGLTGIEGGVRVAGAEQAIVTGLDMAINVSLNSGPVIGSAFMPELFYGPITVTGSVSYFLDSEALVNVFMNETEADIVAMCIDTGSPASFLCFNIQRAKFTAASKQIGGDGGVIVQSPFQALLRTGGAGTAFDQTTLAIQRSNA
jgi:hypothetical protein